MLYRVHLSKNCNEDDDQDVDRGGENDAYAIDSAKLKVRLCRTEQAPRHRFSFTSNQL